jgi:hypothetical protein
MLDQRQQGRQLLNRSAAAELWSSDCGAVTRAGAKRPTMESGSGSVQQSHNPRSSSGKHHRTRSRRLTVGSGFSSVGRASNQGSSTSLRVVTTLAGVSVSTSSCGAGFRV